jgi:hypothetical protein
MFSFLYHCQAIYRTWLYIWITRRVSFKKQELLTLCEHLNSPLVFWWGSCCSSFQFFCVVLLYMCPYVLSSVFWCPVRFPHKSHVRFVFTSSRLSYLRYPIMCLYVPSSVLWCSVRLYLQLFVLFRFSYYVSLRSEFCVVMSVTISA